MSFPGLIIRLLSSPGLHFRPTERMQTFAPGSPHTFPQNNRSSIFLSIVGQVVRFPPLRPSVRYPPIAPPKSGGAALTCLLRCPTSVFLPTPPPPWGSDKVVNFLPSPAISNRESGFPYSPLRDLSCLFFFALATVLSGPGGSFLTLGPELRYDLGFFPTVFLHRRKTHSLVHVSVDLFLDAVVSSFLSASHSQSDKVANLFPFLSLPVAPLVRGLCL